MFSFDKVSLASDILKDMFAKTSAHWIFICSYNASNVRLWREADTERVIMYFILLFVRISFRKF